MIMGKEKVKKTAEEKEEKGVTKEKTQNETEEKEIVTEETKDNSELKVKELEDKVLRVQAELQNYKRRKDEETKTAIKYANEELIEKLLPTLDNFERAIKLDDNDLTDELSKFLEGFKLIYTSFVSVLNDIGLKEIEAIDKPFDPAYHQAVLTDKVETEEDGIILEVLQKGYMFNGRVIRASMVKVNNL